MTTRVTERKLTPKGRATRDRIVEVATELIGARGVAGLNTEHVRERAGVSGSQLYHYFESKQALIKAVITRQADAPGGLAHIGSLDSFEALQAWADAAVTRQNENDGRGECDLGTLARELTVSDQESRVEISQGFLRWQQILRDGLGQMQGRGELATGADIDELSYVLLAALQGGALLSETLGNTAAMRASLNAALTYIRTFAAP